MKTFAICVILTSATILWASAAETQERSKPNDQRVREYVAAFNERNIEAMLSMVTPEIEWLSVTGSKIAVETTGKNQLQQVMTAYFKAVPSAKSELLWVERSPSRVATLEKATWKSNSGEQSQVSLAIYEFRNELISRVYYYPAEQMNIDRTKP